ncbi:MAG: quinohemoprotein amine dehydrogenase subunit alpha [Blastocatellia bacterium]
MKAIKRIVLATFLLTPLVITLTAKSSSQSQAQPAQAQPAQAQTPAADDKSKETAEEGIPVKNQLVIDRCSACHKKDEKGNLTRISFERTTPEGWQQVIKRMIRLNGLTITPDEAKQIVKYLSNNHGLAPEEARPAFYEAEKRVIDEKLPDESLRATCVICHSLGRVLSQRRSKEEWELLGNMHVGLFPVVSFQGFYRFPQPQGAPPPTDPDQRHPVDKSLDYLTKNYPLTTPEWGAWRANLRPPKLQGRWLITGHQTGRGPIYGEMMIEPTSVEDEFKTGIKLRYVKDGSAVTRAGRGIVYTGYSWRGRSNSVDGKEPSENREAMLVSRDWSTMEGRWFWGSYDEFGIDVTLRRIGAEPLIAAVDRKGLKSPSAAVQVHVYGSNLPTDIKPEEIDFGPGIKVTRVVGARSDDVTVEVDVAEGAANGYRDISLRRHFAPRAIAVFDKVDYIKIVPDAGMARVGGEKFPKQFQQFEAAAYNRGPDGKPQTPDDVSLGLVDVEWSVDEFPATFDDDDKDYVGVLGANGLFTPAADGPNPKRRKGVNNYGDIWVIATYKPKDAPADATPLKARSYLVVTVPLYVKWDQPEVSR